MQSAGKQPETTAAAAIIHFLPIFAGPYSPKSPGEWITENPLFTDCAELVSDIADGQIDPPPVRVLEINETAGTCRDATGDIAKAVGQSFMKDGSEPWADLATWLDWHSAPYVDEYDDERSDRAEHGTHFHSMHF